MRTLLPLYVHPWEAPDAWHAVAARGDLTVVVNIADGPGPEIDPGYAAATAALAGAGVAMLGYVDVGYAARPLSDLLADVGRWAAYPVNGVLLDKAPTTPFSVGPVALSVRTARRLGLDEIVLNPGTPPDPVYRDLGVKLCVFEGAWDEYRRWSGHGCMPGDGHLVYGIPAEELPYAAETLAARGAAFGLATDLRPPAPYAGVPAWCARPAEPTSGWRPTSWPGTTTPAATVGTAAGAAGTAGRSARSGS
jgi:hypothetical protein